MSPRVDRGVHGDPPLEEILRGEAAKKFSRASVTGQGHAATRAGEPHVLDLCALGVAVRPDGPANRVE